jgi:hypothetical protein
MVSAPVFSALIGMCFLGLSSGSAYSLSSSQQLVSLKTILSSMQVIIAAVAGGVLCVCLLAKTPTWDVACVKFVPSTD